MAFMLHGRQTKRGFKEVLDVDYSDDRVYYSQLSARMSAQASTMSALIRSSVLISGLELAQPINAKYRMSIKYGNC